MNTGRNPLAENRRPPCAIDARALLLAALGLATLLFSFTTQAQRTTTYTYNAFGQVETVDDPRTDLSDLTRYAYDNQGNRIRTTNALGHVTHITAHDAAGRPTALTALNGVSTQLTYDARGRLTRRTLDGLTTRFRYDAAGNLRGIFRRGIGLTPICRTGQQIRQAPRGTLATAS